MIPFSPPFIDKKITEAVMEALNSGWITTGPRTKLFEKKIGQYCGVDNVLAVNSWTAGAEMLLHWFGIKPGDEVIIPAYTYCATANIIIHCGATPVMVDINDDFCVNIVNIERAITSRTKAIIPVDLGGLPVDYDFLKEIIYKKQHLFSPENPIQQKLGRILLLSDAAHSFGAIYKGNKIGSQADFAVFSFHAVKNLTTAEGGAICINLPTPFDNNEIYRELNISSLHGQSKDALAKTEKGAWEYDVNSAGFKCNMTDILASIGLVEIERYEIEILRRRKQIFEKYFHLLHNYDWAIRPTVVDEFRTSSYHLFLLKVKNIKIEQRNKIIERIFEKDVSVNVHYKPLPVLSFYQRLGYNIDNYQNSKICWETEITLPFYYSLTDNQIELIVKAVVESYNEIIIDDNETNV
jgi:dTDP-4-amino-4,6-dideoxygalactose transaminase